MHVPCYYLLLFSCLSFSSATNGSRYKALYQKYSKDTPVFLNISDIYTNDTLIRNTSLARRSDAQAVGTCGPGEPCANGACCSNPGVCSYAPSSCSSEYCISNCDATAPCGQYANASSSTCPLNVCCSEYGFCGTTDDFCGTGCQEGYGGCGDVTEPSCSGGQSANTITIGYYESWANTRVCDVRSPDDLDLTALTHVNFAFAFFDPTTFQVMPMDSTSGALYSSFTGLKQKKASLKTWISIGGWSFNDASNTPNTRTAFSDMVGSASNRQAFITSLTSFLLSYGFDGVDIDWEYPSATDRGGVTADTANYATFLQDLRAAFGSNYGISMTLPSSYWYLQGFDIATMANYVDWYNFMSYDIHGVWDSSDVYTGPYIRPHTNLTEIKEGLELMWRAGVDPSKVVLGLGWYGRSFTLTDSSCTEPNGVCEFSAGGSPGSCTASSGTLSNAEILRVIAAGGVQTGYDETAAIKWITWDTDQWVSYDDGETMQLKLQAANDLCLAGTMIWSVDQDNTAGDSTNDLLGIGTANGVSESEAQSVKDQINNATLQSEVASSCYWTFCGESCTTGYFAATQARGQVAGVQRDSVCTGETDADVQSLCCAPGTSMGTCAWEGWRGVGMPCTPACNDTSATVVARNTNNYDSNDELDILVDQTCTGGYQAYCCTGFSASSKTNTADLILYGQEGVTKRDVQKRSTKSAAKGGLTTGTMCAAAIAVLVAEAPFTLGLSLLGVAAVEVACIAAGVAIGAIGFSASAGGSTSQTNPNGVAVPASKNTGVATNKGTRLAYGQWSILDFNIGGQASSDCGCSVTYTCSYGLGFDEVCDNQRWAINQLLGGNSVYHINGGRANNREYSSWTKQRKDQFYTLIKGKRTPRSARCELDEFPMGALQESGNNQPQACRLVNGPANQAQGLDFKMWKTAQWQPCSEYRKTACKSKDSGPPAHWDFGPFSTGDSRGQGSGKHFVEAYGFNSQTANSECFASYSFTGADGKQSATMVADHGFRALLDDPMFGSNYGWTMQDYKINPAPKASSNLRPVDVASANYLKRDLALDAIVANATDENEGQPLPNILDYHIVDLDGLEIDVKQCDLLYDDDSGATIYFNSLHVPPNTQVNIPQSSLTEADNVPTVTPGDIRPVVTFSSTVASETGAGHARSGVKITTGTPVETVKPELFQQVEEGW